MRSASQTWGWLIAAAFLALASPVTAQVDPAVADEFVFWEKDKAMPARAAQVVGMGSQPFVAFSMRKAGFDWLLWDEGIFTQDIAPPLSDELLKGIRDGRPMPDIANQPKNEVPPEDWALYKAFSEAMIFARETPLSAFKKNAEENKHVTHAHLMATPAKYRGKVVAVTGRLKMLRREDPTLLAKKGHVKDTFVGWVFGPTRHATPYCIQFPNLPPGLDPGEDMNVQVTFYGYFLATFKYKGAPDGDRPRILTTPLLVGPTVVVHDKAEIVEEAETPLAIIVLGVAISFVLFLSVVFFVMYFWLQRGDRKVLRTLDEIKRKHLPNQFEGDDLGTRANPASAQLITELPPGVHLPEARPIEGRPVDPERN